MSFAITDINMTYSFKIIEAAKSTGTATSSLSSCFIKIPHHKTCGT